MEVKRKLSGVMQKHLNDSQSEFCVLSFKEFVRIKDALAVLKIPAELPILILLNKIVKNDEQILKNGDTPDSRGSKPYIPLANRFAS